MLTTKLREHLHVYALEMSRGNPHPESWLAGVRASRARWDNLAETADGAVARASLEVFDIMVEGGRGSRYSA